MHRLGVFVSGHGYGHATRTAEVLRSIGRKLPEVQFFVRTRAPKHLFANTSVAGTTVLPSSVDPGVVEAQDALSIDVEKTLRRLRGFERRRSAIVARETEFVRRNGIEVLISDIPYICGDISEASGVPCIGIGNFTWDWIYEPYLADAPILSEIGERIRESYRAMRRVLWLPFSPTANTSMFEEIIEAPLIARRSTRDAQQIARMVGVDKRESRTRVLFASRVEQSGKVLREVARRNGDCLILNISPVPVKGLPNVLNLQLRTDIEFSDIIGVCDVVVAKLGYGMLAECVAAGKPILAPSREGFREDEVLDRGAAEYVRCVRLSKAQFFAGDWRAGIRQLLDLPEPGKQLDVTGADFCADYILSAMLC